MSSTRPRKRAHNESTSSKRALNNNFNEDGDSITEVDETSEALLELYSTIPAKGPRQASLLYGVTVEQAVNEFKRFIELKCLYNDTDAKKLSPTAIMDTVWHEAILDTKWYQKLQEMVGRTLHHVPVDEETMTSTELEARALRRLNTEAAYRLRYDDNPLRPEVMVDAAVAAVTLTGMPGGSCATAAAAASVSHHSRDYFVIIKDIMGRNTVVNNLNQANTIDAVKFKFYTETRGYPPEKQRLIFSGKILEDGRTLADYNIPSGSTIDLAIRLVGC